MSSTAELFEPKLLPFLQFYSLVITFQMLLGYCMSFQIYAWQFVAYTCFEELGCFIPSKNNSSLIRMKEMLDT